MRVEVTVGLRRAVVEVRPRDGGYAVVVDGQETVVEVDRAEGALWAVRVDGRRLDAGVVRTRAGYLVEMAGLVRDVVVEEGRAAGAGPHPRAATGPVRITAPMPGRVVRVLVAAGDEVRAGQGLVVMEAMKMENEIRAPRDGRVKDVAVGERQAVETGALLATLEPPQT